MRKLFRILGVLVLLVLLAAGIGYIWLQGQHPEYEGHEPLPGLTDKVEVYHDAYGIPHIFASNKKDLYKALGYLTARERYFQMDLARRLGGGRLSEVFGEAALETDILFRCMLPDSVNQMVTDAHIHKAQDGLKDEILAYLDGVNAYVASEELPLECRALGLEKQAFTAEDLYRVAGYMAYGFSLGGRTDPVITDVLNKLGPAYLEGLGVLQDSLEAFNPVYPSDTLAAPYTSVSNLLTDALMDAPVPKFIGSNSWVVSGSKTKSGKPILCNDTHIGFGIPQVWYEAHLECPNFSFYGNFLPGIPYALVGHNRDMAWGVTMLENDDMDLYLETPDPGDPDFYLVDSVAYPFRKDELTIGVKDFGDTTVAVRATMHGPVVNDVFANLHADGPVSCWWDYTRTPNFLLETFRTLNNCQSMGEAEAAISQVSCPGLNITYADSKGNIAWWTSAKWLERPQHVFSKALIDGSKQRNTPLGYLPWSENPRSVNPSWKYVYTANDQPEPMQGSFQPGYYKPSHRAERIQSLLESRDDWDVSSMQAVITDVTCTKDQELFQFIADEIEGAEGISQEDFNLTEWSGGHEVEDISPTLFYMVLYHILDNTMTDEMGSEWLHAFFGTHWHARAYPLLIQDPDSPWWDDVSTPEKEGRKDILTRSFIEAIESLEEQLGKDRSSWTWGRVHTLKLKHPFDQGSEFLGSIFNIEEAPFRGGHETINQAGFSLNPEGRYPARYGAQMRIIIDLADVPNSKSITPSGQSGHRYSPHYADQAEDYRLGGFRLQDMDSTRIKSTYKMLILEAD